MFMNVFFSGCWCARVAQLQSNRSACCRFWVQFLDRICRLLICLNKLLFFICEWKPFYFSQELG